MKYRAGRKQDWENLLMARLYRREDYQGMVLDKVRFGLVFYFINVLSRWRFPVNIRPEFNIAIFKYVNDFTNSSNVNVLSVYRLFWNKLLIFFPHPCTSYTDLNKEAGNGWMWAAFAQPWAVTRWFNLYKFWNETCNAGSDWLLMRVTTQNDIKCNTVFLKSKLI